MSSTSSVYHPHVPSPFIWNSTLDVGDHRRNVEHACMMNFVKAIETTNRSRTAEGRKVTTAMFKRFVYFCVDGFRLEEQLMHDECTDENAFQSHKDSHTSFLEDLHALFMKRQIRLVRSKSRKGKSLGREDPENCTEVSLVESDILFIKNWIISHIHLEDKRLYGTLFGYSPGSVGIPVDKIQWNFEATSVFDILDNLPYLYIHKLALDQPLQACSLTDDQMHARRRRLDTSNFPTKDGGSQLNRSRSKLVTKLDQQSRKLDEFCGRPPLIRVATRDELFDSPQKSMALKTLPSTDFDLFVGMESVSYGHILFDLSDESSTIIAANLLLCRLTGYEPWEICGRTIKCLLSAFSDADNLETVREAFTDLRIVSVGGHADSERAASSLHRVAVNTSSDKQIEALLHLRPISSDGEIYGLASVAPISALLSFEHYNPRHIRLMNSFFRSLVRGGEIHRVFGIKPLHDLNKKKEDSVDMRSRMHAALTEVDDDDKILDSNNNGPLSQTDGHPLVFGWMQKPPHDWVGEYITEVVPRAVDSNRKTTTTPDETANNNTYSSSNSSSSKVVKPNYYYSSDGIILSDYDGSIELPNLEVVCESVDSTYFDDDDDDSATPAAPATAAVRAGRSPFPQLYGAAVGRPSQTVDEPFPTAVDESATPSVQLEDLSLQSSILASGHMSRFEASAGPGIVPYFCAVFSTFAIVILSVFGSMLIQHNPTFEIPDSKKVRSGYACFLAAGFYLIAAVTSLISIRNAPSAKSGARVLDIARNALRQARIDRYGDGSSGERQTELRPLLTDSG